VGGRGSNLTSVVGIIVIVWLVIGALAALQRGYFSDDRDVNCRTGADTVLTIVAGPLNYLGVNPKVDCQVPQPSK
jgi:hypothetical protein